MRCVAPYRCNFLFSTDDLRLVGHSSALSPAKLDGPKGAATLRGQFSVPSVVSFGFAQDGVCG